MYNDAFPPPQMWTEEQDAVLLARINDHPFPVNSVSKMLGRTPRSIKARVIRLREKMRNGGKLVTETSQRGRVHPPLPPGHRRPKGRNDDLIVLICLGCQKPFKSWDKIKNRLCHNCTGRHEDITHVRHAAIKGA